MIQTKLHSIGQNTCQVKWNQGKIGEREMVVVIKDLTNIKTLHEQDLIP